MASQFITLEGGEGAGKTTQVRLLAASLEAAGLPVLATREPGGTPGAEAVRHLLVNGAGDRWVPLAETLLHMAARAEHVERVIKPALAAGRWVLCDRFVDSTAAYQGRVQGLGTDLVRGLHAQAFAGFMPDLTVLIDIDPEIGLARARSRDPAGAAARYERLGLDFHRSVRQAFRDFAATAPDRFVMIDGAADEVTVAAALRETVAQRFGLALA